VLFSDDVTQALTSSNFVCRVGDLTEENAIASDAMKSLARNAVPVTAIYDPVEKTWQVQADVFTAEDVKGWITSLESKIAGEKTEAPNGP
jgi:thiol:disulfide interchange protein